MFFSVLLAALLAPPAHLCMGCDLSGMSLANTDFGGAVYVATNFANATFTGSSFRGATLVAANFEGADLRNVAFDQAQCTACNFRGAKLDGDTFTGARMVAANFNGFSAVVADAELRELLARCFACNFRGASFAGKDFSGGSLIGVDLSNADLRNARFDGAALCAYVIAGKQRTMKCATLQGARTDGASFKDVRICSDPAQPSSCAVMGANELRRALALPPATP